MEMLKGSPETLRSPKHLSDHSYVDAPSLGEGEVDVTEVMYRDSPERSVQGSMYVAGQELDTVTRQRPPCLNSAVHIHEQPNDRARLIGHVSSG